MSVIMFASMEHVITRAMGSAETETKVHALALSDSMVEACFLQKAPK